MAAAKTLRKTVTFRGNVQGVGFRATTRDVARRFAVTGTVKNLPDGNVLVVVEGEDREIDAFLAAVEAEMGRNIANRYADDSAATDEFASFEIVY